MRIALALFAALLCLAGSTGCAPSCKEACENVAKVCADVFAAANLTLDVAGCEDRCSNNSDSCTNLSDQRQCAADAKTCDDFKKCPTCLQ